ncbi:MAG: universal stress protein UspA [Zestosphaera tikiterensis]|uniref:Universal stress protein UspA n=1 Tax=Zestosphaera tikiterensis TaxID=1973259 RepID=A0A2R7Y7L6_9CREN|nr:MAG: universal stress protein UspA [Zestosphaera tikiterensis]
MSYVPEPTYVISYLFRKVLIPIDGSSTSLKALDVGLDFALRYGSKLTALIVDDGSEEDVNALKDKIEKIAGKRGIKINVKIKKPNLRETSTSTAIIEEIQEEHYDLIILTARGKSVNPDLTLGATALSVIVNSNTSVLLIR